MRAAFQIDPIAGFNTAHDSSFLLMLEAQARGIEIWCFEPAALIYDSGELLCACQKLRLEDKSEDFFQIVETARRPVSDFDWLLIRQDPPFDMAYYANTYLLELASDQVKILNHPGAVRNVPEKLSALHFQDYLPATLITRDVETVKQFARRFDAVVLKPLSLFGGSMVFKSHHADPALPEYADKLLAQSREPFITQEFLPGVAHGDKRVMILQGKVIGVLGRIPPQGEFVANIHAGGRPVLAELSEREQEICRVVGQQLQDWGIFFAGIDLIDGYLGEINVTSPTLMRELIRLGGPDVAKAYWDALLAA